VCIGNDRRAKYESLCAHINFTPTHRQDFFYFVLLCLVFTIKGNYLKEIFWKCIFRGSLDFPGSFVWDLIVSWVDGTRGSRVSWLGVNQGPMNHPLSGGSGCSLGLIFGALPSSHRFPPSPPDQSRKIRRKTRENRPPKIPTNAG
jgi:hypothetical protein